MTTEERLQELGIELYTDIQPIGSYVPYVQSGNLVFILRDADGNKVESSGFVAHKVDGEGYTSEKVNVLVASQAIQASGFGNATDALNTGFGTGTNPWKP